MSKRLCRHLMEESIDYARAEFLAKDRQCSHASMRRSARRITSVSTVTNSMSGREQFISVESTLERPLVRILSMANS
jgi:hypothetical protein